MRVFELLTALCVYSQDGYELVLQALHDFQVNIIDFHLEEKDHISERSNTYSGRLELVEFFFTHFFFSCIDTNQFTVCDIVFHFSF